MRTVEFSTTTTLPAPADVVFDHLADPSNHLGLSPVSVEVRDIRRGPHEARYTVVELFKFGPLSRRNVIDVTLRLGDGVITGDVVSPGGVRIEWGYRFVPVPGGTDLVDHYRLSAPFGLLRFSMSQAKKVQVARGQELVRRFQA
ncbi:SRPBCC family protein [Herbidospora sp. RD11066]